MEKDVFDYIDEDEENKPFNTDIVWNILTVVIVLLVLCVGVVFLTIFTNPNAGLNPFPPPTMPAISALDTLTPTPKSILPPTWTPTYTSEPTATETPEPTITLPVVVDATETPSLTPEEEAETDGDMPFVLHEGNPQYIPNLYHAELGCDWMGVGGQVLSLNGAPVTGVVVKLGGQLAGETVELLTVTGIATQYGPAGYEFDLTEVVEGPTASSHSLWVQLLDQAGLAMSDKVYFETYQECDRSTIIIYFKQVK
jgi:hypothetical protein